MLSFGLFAGLTAQTPMKQIPNKPFVEPKPLQIKTTPAINSGSNRLGGQWHPGTLSYVKSKDEAVRSVKVATSGSFWIADHACESAANSCRSSDSRTGHGTPH